MSTSLYTFRPGAVDHIAKTRNLATREQLAAFLCVPLENLDRVAEGQMPVTARYALYIAGAQGDHNYLAGLFEPYFETIAA